MSTGETASAWGVSVTTLHRWEASGWRTAQHTAGGPRRYDLAKSKPEQFRAGADALRRTVAYACVSSHDPKDDLERPKQVSARNWVCPACGRNHDRDVNAALNLKNLAVSSTVSACGEQGSGRARKSAVKPASRKQEASSRFCQK